MSKICNNPCQKIICAVPDDLATYNLQNPPPPVPNPENAFLSVQVEVDNVCVTGTLAFTGTVPNWIQIDTINNRVVGIAGAISGSTQNRANARALAELNAFIAAQILAGNMTCGAPPSTGGLAAYFKLDEVSGTRLDVNGANPLTESELSVGSIAGIIGNAVDFLAYAGPGTRHWLQTNGEATLFFTTSFSISFWMKSDTDNSAIMVADSGSAWEIDLVQNGGSPLIRFVCGNGSGVSTCAFPADTNWHYVVCVCDLINQLTKIYVDGALGTTDAGAVVTAGSPAGLVYFKWDDNVVPGTILALDEMGFWNLVLTPAEVTQLYNGG